MRAGDQTWENEIVACAALTAPDFLGSEEEIHPGW